MKEKLILFDVDDTIIDHHTDKSEIPEQTRQTIQALKERGHKVGLATGRSKIHASYVMELLGLDTAVTFGGHLVTCDGVDICRHSLPVDEVQRLLEQFKDTPYPIMAVTSEQMYLKDYKDKVKTALFNEKDLIEGEPPYDPNTLLKPLDDSAREYMSMMVFSPTIKDKDSFKNLEFNPWGERGFEVYAKGVSKFSGIEYLAKHLNMSLEDVFVFGDSYNDLHMLEHIPHSIAVGNAVEAAKKVASYVAPPIYENGIRIACEHFGLLEG